MKEGYGHDWTIYDGIVQQYKEKLIEKFGNTKYRNFALFKSPKGRLMAFFNTSYVDIKIIDLETMDIVVENFYSNFDGTWQNQGKDYWYASHTNASTHVPNFFKGTYETKTGLKEYYTSDSDLDELNSIDNIFSAPFAFNAWTIWAADYEFYVDVIDLSLVDDGKIRKYTKPTFTIPISASHIRNYIKYDLESWNDNDACIDIKYLKEEFDIRCHQPDNFALENMYTKEKYSIHEQDQWKIDMEKYNVNKNKK